MSGTPDRRFLRLVDDPGDRLLRAARLLCGDWTQAEEVLQRALARTLATWDGRCGTGEAALRARRELVATYVDGLHARGGPLRVGRHADHGLVDGLGDLDPMTRAVVVARYYLRLPERDTAEVVGAAPAHVRDVAGRCLDWLGTATAPAR